VRPTDELIERLSRPSGAPPSPKRTRPQVDPPARAASTSESVKHGACTILCEAGDILVLSTRDWWHSTCLPPLGGGLSVSYAREFTLPPAREPSRAGQRPTHRASAASLARDDHAGEDDAPTVFTNVDGLFAASSIAAGTVVATEEDPSMAEAELPVDTDPNCEVMEDEETGLMCLVALRDIRSGEFLSVAPDED
jgi:hypothetical protein